MQTARCKFRVLMILCAWTLTVEVGAGMRLGEWTLIFKGIEHARGTNTPSVAYPSKNVLNALRIDLTDPDIKLFTDPRVASNYIPDRREVTGSRTKDYLTKFHLQAALNSNRYDYSTAADIYGLCICTGVVTSAQNSADSSQSLVFDSMNRGEIYANWPARSNEGIYTAISGSDPLVVKGVNVAQKIDQHPRTAFGLSQDRRYLYAITIDGRQAGYSDGAYDFETAAWMIFLGAYDAMNVDGGGSTTMVIEDKAGKPQELNRPSDVGERVVASHFGIYAKPAPDFINDIVASADDTAARINWTTRAEASTQVEYGLDQNLASFTALDAEPTMSHTAILTGLTADTAYFFRVVSSAGGTEYTSATGSFETTNYFATNIIFEVTNAWRYTTINQDATNWMDSSYDDSSWSGPSSGLLWVDTRAGGPAPGIGPRNTQMPFDPATGFPYGTYYLRTHFGLDELVPGSVLLVSGFVDDGAVLYLNGNEVTRLRMAAQPEIITYSSLAIGYPGAGDAVREVVDRIEIPSTAGSKLIVGDNVLAARVHNYNARSPDITFGLALSALVPRMRSPQLKINDDYGTLILTWVGDIFALQEARSPLGPWKNSSGAYTSSPYHATISVESNYYRLVKP
jgi:hypothetical protein